MDILDPLSEALRISPRDAQLHGGKRPRFWSQRTGMSGAMTGRSRRPRDSITAPGLLLGVGFGGLFDGILLHQILQWHHMLSSEGCCAMTSVRGLELNTLADGLFHLASLALLALGTVMLWRRIHGRGVAWSGRQLFGLMLEGWGLFNLVEGLVDHHVVGLHHVHGGQYRLAYDIGFLLFGAMLVIAGNLLARTRPPDLKATWRALSEPLPTRAP
jgi:uncharacterized membrane protein